MLNLALDDDDKELRNATGRLIMTAAQNVMVLTARVGDQKLQKDHNEALLEIIKGIQEEQKLRTIDGSADDTSATDAGG
jgi:hypothetical protein